MAGPKRSSSKTVRCPSRNLKTREADAGILGAPEFPAGSNKEIEMNTAIRIAAVLATVAAPAFAQDSLPPIQVAPYVANCERPSLPTQRQVGEWTGLQNFGQVYAARERLMADIGRACQRPGVDRVKVVIEDGQGREDAGRRVAVASGR
jgi:hypothetical protein